jgi:hypothetical protein
MSLTLCAASEILAYIIILREALSVVCVAGVVLMKHCVLTHPAASGGVQFIYHYHHHHHKYSSNKPHMKIYLITGRVT